MKNKRLLCDDDRIARLTVLMVQYHIRPYDSGVTGNDHNTGESALLAIAGERSEESCSTTVVFGERALLVVTSVPWFRARKAFQDRHKRMGGS